MLDSATRPISVTVTETPDAAQLAEWDALVGAHPGADVVQLSGWGRLRRLAGYTPLHVLAHDAGRIVGGAQVLVRRVPLLGAVGYAPSGPIVFGHAERPDDVRALLAGALRDLVGSRLRILFAQPPADDEPSSRALLERGFRRSDAGISPSASLRVDLSADVEELRRNLTKKVRKSTRQWADQGVTVRVGGLEDLPEFADLVGRTGAFQGFTGFGLEYLTTMYRELSARGHVLLLVGEHEGRPVAMQLCTGCGGVLTARMTGFDRSSPAANLRVPAATIWAAMQWGKEHGYRWFDFGGIEEHSMAVLEAGGRVEDMARFDQSKTGWGGRPFRYPPAVERFASPVLRLAYDAARRSAAGRSAVEWVKRVARSGRATGR